MFIMSLYSLYTIASVFFFSYEKLQVKKIDAWKPHSCQQRWNLKFGRKLDQTRQRYSSLKLSSFGDSVINVALI